MIVSFRLGGGYAPNDPSTLNLSSVAARAVGEMLDASAAVYLWRVSGGGFVGNGCVGQVCSPGRVVCAHRAFFDRPQRPAGHAVEHEEQPVLGSLRDSVDLTSVLPDGKQHRRRRQILVEQVVMGDLKMPETLARIRVERNERVGEKIGAVTVPPQKSGVADSVGT